MTTQNKTRLKITSETMRKLGVTATRGEPITVSAWTHPCVETGACARHRGQG